MGARTTTSVLLLAFVMALNAACGGSSSTPAETPTPTQPSALEIWARTLNAHEDVNSVRMNRTFYAGGAPYMDDVTFVRGGAASVPGFTPWIGEAPLPNFPGGYFNRDTPSLTNIRILGRELIDGRPHWLVGFEGSESGIDTIRYFSARAWIDAETFLIRRLEDTTTRGEGCCGAPEPGLNSVSDYTEYELGPYALATPRPTETPTSPPPILTIEPAAGPCDEEVTMRSDGIQPRATLSGRATIRFFSEYGPVTGGELSSPLFASDVIANDRGELEASLRLADHWCASTAVAIGQTIQLSLVLRGDNNYFHHVGLEYTVAPCHSLPDLTLTSPRLCFNIEPPLTPSSPTP